MSRTYIVDANGKVTNAKPRKKPKWTTDLPKKPGFYFSRPQGSMDLDVFYIPEPPWKIIGNNNVEWWPVRIKEPK